MAATISSEISRNYKYPYFDPITRDWNIDITKIKYFQFVNYINKSHNQMNTLYLIFDAIPKLNQSYILPFTYSNNLAVLNDNSKFSLKNLMPQYLSGANHLKDVFVSIIDVNKLIKLFSKNFKNMEIYHQQLEKIDKANQNQIKISKNKHTNKINNNSNKHNNSNNNNNNNNNKKDKIKETKMSTLKSTNVSLDIEMKNGKNDDEFDRIDSKSSNSTNTENQNLNQRG